jgi:hypothetical protein
MQVFLPPEASVTTTAAIVELLRFFTNAGSIKDAVDRIVAERERLVAAAEEVLRSRACPAI